MKRMARTAVVVSGFLLLAATPAFAGCAWVMWISVNAGWNFKDAEVTPSGAFDSQEACERVMLRTATKMAKIGNRTISPDGGTVMSWRGKPPRPSDETPLLVQSWQCFPDTIDPRGRKTK
jgi:hypothetical protein